MKTENDYIAEYVKEKHPSILGADYAMWKIGRIGADVVYQIVETIKSIDLTSVVNTIKTDEEEVNDEKNNS